MTPLRLAPTPVDRIVGACPLPLLRFGVLSGKRSRTGIFEREYHPVALPTGLALDGLSVDHDRPMHAGFALNDLLAVLGFGR
jgi:hypothetical protein